MFKKKQRRGISHGSIDVDEGGLWGIPLTKRTYPIVVEVAEQERVGDLSRIKIIEISGCPRNYRRQLKDLIPEWVKTSEISWLTES